MLMVKLISITFCLKYIGCSNLNSFEDMQPSLLSSLFSNYSRFARPVLNSSQPTLVSFHVKLKQVLSLDEKSQVIVTNLWIYQAWKNEYLVWNSDEWDGVNELEVPSEYVWTPDILLHNSVNQDHHGGTEKYKTKIQIEANGKNKWVSPAIFKSTCQVRVTHFPFDRHECWLKFGSWNSNKDSVDVVLDRTEVPVLTSEHTESTEWQILDAELLRTEETYIGYKGVYAAAELHVRLQRKPLFYIVTAVAPSFILMVLLLLSFYLPPQSGERMSLTITVFLAITVFQQLVSDQLPRSSDDFPRLGFFFLMVIFEGSLCLIFGCCAIRMHHKESNGTLEPVPRWLRLMFIKKKQSTLITRTKEDKFERNSSIRHSKTDYNYDNNHLHTSINKRHIEDNNYNDKLHCPECIFTAIEQRSLEAVQMRGSRGSIQTKTITKDKRKSSTKKRIQSGCLDIKVIANDWKQVANGIDQFLFWTFLSISTAAFVILMLPCYLQYE